MIRSLYSGISGLRNHQVAMDVTGNNIANVNTTGFKAGRVTFEESMAQLLRGASRPPGNAGGTNPMQVGLGMSIASVDTILIQGNLQSTGQITDLALEGRGYFVFNNGLGNLYSRNGALQMDSTGRLVSPTNGFVLQGQMAAPNGTFPPGTPIGDIRIPFGEKAPPQQTTLVRFGCNLDSDSEALGSVAHTQRFLQSVDPQSTLLTELYNQSGRSLGIRAGDVLTVSAGNQTPATLLVTETTTLGDLVNAISTVAMNAGGGMATVAVNADGTISITNNGTPITNLTVSSNRPQSTAFVVNAFSWGPTIDSGQTRATGGLRTNASSTTALANLFDSVGNPLGLETGDTINVNGMVGGSAIETLSALYVAAGEPVPPGNTLPVVTTMQDLLTLIQQGFRLPEFDQNGYPSVGIDNASIGDDRIPDGSIVIRGQPEVAFALEGLSITAVNGDPTTPHPIRFTSNMAMTPIQFARDTGVHSSSITVYDATGDAHVLTMTFIHSGNPNEWLWQVNMEGGEQVLGGSTGRITFGQDGSPASFTYDDDSTRFRFDPMNGSDMVSIQLDPGSPGAFEGVTQFRSPSTTAARFQNGYPMGKIEEISIDEFGEIQGLYSNGVTQAIARIYVADFNNPAGLFRKGDSMYQESNNSGQAVLQRPGVGSSTRIKPGALEMSNVELATEFTNMITTQRGYQANARVITTSDSLLQELVALVR